MSGNFFSGDIEEAMILSLIAGWAKSRGGTDVSVLREHGAIHCLFAQAIGKIPRERESFYWNCEDIAGNAAKFHGNHPHFLSVFGVSNKTHERLLSENYKVISRETHMYKYLDAEEPTVNDAVIRVSTREQADWYNDQKGTLFIKPIHLSDPDMYDFYTEHKGIMTSHARAIRSGNYLVIDDVHTRPEYRRKGLAMTLLSAITSVALLRQFRALTLISSKAGVPLYLRDNYQSGPSLTVYSSSN
ncbi:GNAT family N-acetyltransferase [Xenorhabdus sp. IM139775]|uniref:GNAT family N-acetyltransferase n=1 Tax=Xenorhabdus sp. IM139775 TaxID=3025876 RepID=UPI0023595B45|nr:GNAT family N-acetyltransferase [Xenorhabdus sp. IM139775]MDC9594778.1 GNAT family N-acetyltransferase [Xenorhabdus sp. IM139775]